VSIANGAIAAKLANTIDKTSGDDGDFNMLPQKKRAKLKLLARFI
jgi:hypothetical protein